jgi:hypothetical protein
MSNQLSDRAWVADDSLVVVDFGLAYGVGHTNGTQEVTVQHSEDGVATIEFENGIVGTVGEESIVYILPDEQISPE